MKKRKLTKKEFKELEKNLTEYLTVNTNFSVECYGGQLLAIIMALKMFSELEDMPDLVVSDFRALVENFKHHAIKEFPGVQLIDFDNPGRYFVSLINAENQGKIEDLIFGFDELCQLIEKQIRSDN